MTAVIGGISVYLEDDTARFQQSMARNAGLVEQQSQRMTRALGNTARSVDELNRRAGSFQPDAFRSLALSALHAENSVERLRTVMLAVTALATGSFAGAFGAKLLQDTADRYSDIQNKIAAVVPDVRARAGIEQQIYDTANRSLSAYEATAVLFQRLQLSASNLGGTQSEILRVVETTQKALKAGGATTQEAASAAVQLSQALGAGRLQGDELRSILENAPILAQAIAKEFGVAVGELKTLGSEGQLTSNRVFRAILNSSQSVDDAFSAMKPTISQALVVLDNAFTRFLGQVDQSLGASNALAQGIVTLSKNLSTLGDIAALVGPLVAGVFVSRAIRSAGGSVTAPYREEIARRKEALAQAQALEQQTAERVVNAGSRTADLRTRARTDLESFADQGVRKNRDQVARDVAAGVEKVKKAQDEFQAVVQRTSGVDVAAVARSAEKVHASSELKGLREEVGDAQKQVKAAEADLAAANTAATRSVLSSREAERLTKLRQSRAELQEQITSADSRIASLQAEAAGLPDARVGSRTRTRSARADALDEEMTQRATARNETGLAVYRATKEIAELEQRLAESTSAVRKKAVDEAEKVGAALIKAEEAVVAQREVLAKREAATSGRDVTPEAARRRTDEQVLARIEQEIRAQERLDELVKRRDALAKRAVDLVDVQQVGAGSLGAGDVKKLNEARRERDFFTQQLADQDAQLDSLRAERDRLRSGIGPRSARNLERDAETARQRDAINAEIAQVEAARAEAMKRFEATRGSDGVDEKRLQLQERLNAALEREAATSGPVKNRTEAQERLNKVLREDVELRNAIRDIDTTGADRIVEASQKVENAKRRVAEADRTIRNEVAQRVGQERGTANSQIMAEISDAAVNRRNAQGDLRTSQGLLDAAGDEVRANATANATRQIAQAQQQSAIAAAGYQRAQDAVAVATARTGAATTFLTTTLGLARAGFASLYGFLGGFWGVALTAATTGLALYEIAQARAAARTEEFKRATDAAAASVKALNEARTSGPAIQATALSGANQTLGVLQTGLQEALDNALRAVPRTQAVQSVDEFGRATITSTNAQYDALSRLGQKLDETRKQGGDTRGIIQQMIEEIDRLGSQSIDMAGILGPLRELLGVALNGAEALRNLRAAANQAAAARGDFDDARDARLRAASRISPEGARRADLNQQRLAAENSPDAMEKLGEYMNQYYEGRRKAQNNFTRAFEKETLTSKGDKVGARMTDLRSQYPGIDEDELKRLAVLQEQNSKSGSKKPAKTEEEKFADRLARLQEEGRAAFFTDTDRAVVEELKKIKGEPTLLRNTVDAMKNGGPLPQQAQQVKEAILMKEAGREYRSIIQSYGTLEQITPEVANQQAKLNALLNAGKISADQYNLALADFMGKYKQFAWIDSISDSLSSVSGELAEAALGFKKIDDIANSFLQTMLKFGLNEFLMTPLKNMLKGFFAEASAGGGGGLNPISFIARMFGGGGGDDLGGSVDNGEWFADGGHVRGPGGPTSDSILAHLSNGEFVVKASATQRHLPLLEAINDGKLGPLLATAGRLPRFATGGMVGRVSQSAGSSLADMVGGGTMNVSIEPPAGHRANVEGRTSPNGPSARVTFEQMFAEDLTSNGPMAQALQGLYGMNRMAGRRS